MISLSFSRGEEVRTVVASGAQRTVLLTVLAFITEVLIGIPLALFVVSRKGRWADRFFWRPQGQVARCPAFLSA